MSHRNRPQSLLGAGLAGAVASALIYSSPARADFVIHSWEDHHRPRGTWSLLPSAGVYSSSANFDLDNVSTPINGLEGYSRMILDIDGSYGLAEKLTVYARMSWARVAVDHASLVGTAFGLADQTLGLTFHAWTSSSRTLPVRLDFQLQGDFPGYSNESALESNTPYLGDGSIDLTTGAFLNAPFARWLSGRWTVETGAGYTYRTQDYSAAIPWSAKLKYEPEGSGFGAIATLAGVYSLRTDPRANGTTVPSLPPAGGSVFIGAVNPSILTARADLSYVFGPKLALIGTYSKSFWGTNAPDGTYLGLGLRMGIGDPSGASPLEQTPEEYGKSNQGFVDYTFEARVIRVNDRLHLVKINKGSEAGVEMGQIYDIFKVSTAGKIDSAIARAKVTGVKAEEAALTITEYFKEVWIEEGFLVKRPLQ